MQALAQDFSVVGILKIEEVNVLQRGLSTDLGRSQCRGELLEVHRMDHQEAFVD